MKSAKPTDDGTKGISLQDAESAAKRAEAEAKAAKVFFKKSKVALKLARKTAKNARKAARKIEKDATRARKTFDRLRKQAKKLVVRTKKDSAKKAAVSLPHTPAKTALRRKSLAALASDSNSAASERETSLKVHAPTEATPASLAAEAQDPTSGFPPQLERPEDDHSEF